MKYSTSLVGEIIKSERKKRGWTQATLSKKLNISDNQISKYEKGELVPPISTLFDLCEIFNCELGYLLGEQDYSEGDKLQTAIYNTIGLNRESIKTLNAITGTSRRSPEFGTSPEKYKRIVNAFFSSDYIFHFFDCLEKLDYCISQKESIQDELNKLHEKSLSARSKIGDDTFLDYLESDLELSDEVIGNIKELTDILSRQESIVYPTKFARYELCEAFEELIQDIYPKNSWEY